MFTLFKSQRGVTILELLITTVIIGIVSAMAVPRFQTAVERLKIRSGGQEMNSVMKLARSNAISNKQPYGLHFDSDKMIVTLFEENVVPGSTVVVFDNADSIVHVDTLPQEFKYLDTDCDGDVIVFQPNGSCSFVGGGNIYAIATTEKVTAIIINNVLASTGRVNQDNYVY